MKKTTSPRFTKIPFSKEAGGGFVLHGIEGDFQGRMSAWYSEGGELLDAEQIVSSARASRPVRRGGPMWELCQSKGRIHAPAHPIEIT